MRTRKELTISNTHRYVTIEQVVRDTRPETVDLDTLFETWGLKRSVQERFWVITYDGDKMVNTITETAVGSYRGQTVWLAPTLAAVLASGTDRFMVAHNHPSGSLSPSPEDLDLTITIAEGAAIAGLLLEDHLIVGPKGRTFSFAEHGLINPGEVSHDAILKQIVKRARKAKGA